MCFSKENYLLPGNSFTYSKNSDFVEFLKNETAERKWFDYNQFWWDRREDVKFAETLSTYGIGFSFNLLEDFNLFHLNQTSNDFKYSYKEDSSSKKRPWKTGKQEESGLIAKFLQSDHPWIHICHEAGFIVHSPFELVSKSDRITTLSYSGDIKVLITLEIFQSDEDLRSIPADHRNCYFEDERNLTYFKVYTKKNCEAECLSFIGELFKYLTDFFNLKYFQFTKSASVSLFT